MINRYLKVIDIKIIFFVNLFLLPTFIKRWSWLEMLTLWKISITMRFSFSAPSIFIFHIHLKYLNINSNTLFTIICHTSFFILISPSFTSEEFIFYINYSFTFFWWFSNFSFSKGAKYSTYGNNSKPSMFGIS